MTGRRSLALRRATAPTARPRSTGPVRRPAPEALALVVIDPDARDFVHWVAFDLTGAPDGHLAADLAASATTPGQGQNGFGKRGYGGPCPPSGNITTCSRSPRWTDRWGSAGPRRWQRSRRR